MPVAALFTACVGQVNELHSKHSTVIARKDALAITPMAGLEREKTRAAKASRGTRATAARGGGERKKRRDVRRRGRDGSRNDDAASKAAAKQDQEDDKRDALAGEPELPR